MDYYLRYSMPIIEKIAEWERLNGTAACMVDDLEKIKFWNFISEGLAIGSARGALSCLED